MSDISREHSVSQAQFYKWRSKYGGMDASIVKRLKELEDKNNRLKKMYAEEKLISDVCKEGFESVVTPFQRNEMAERAKAEFDVSIRVACLAITVSESCYQCQAHCPPRMP